MSDTITETAKVRFGMTSTRELEIEAEPGHDVATEFETAVAKGTPLLWIRDIRGHRHGIVVEKVAFIEIESARRRDVGFASES